jgi:AcrR family transcriptional regulator
VPDRDGRIARDPLDHLIRSTVPTTAASAVPRRAGGTRSRAGNSMARTRAGLLDGARRAAAQQGSRRTTMNDIAAAAGVAKATLYNHFRTKDDVWAALVEAEVRAVAAECTELQLVDALAHAARRVSEHAALRRVADAEPAALAGLLTRRPPGAGWRAAEETVRARLAAEGLAGDDLVLRWLASHLAAPASPTAIRAAAEALARGLSPDPAADRKVPA